MTLEKTADAAQTWLVSVLEKMGIETKVEVGPSELSEKYKVLAWMKMKWSPLIGLMPSLPTTTHSPTPPSAMVSPERREKYSSC